MAVKCKLVRGAVRSGRGSERDNLPFAVFLVETDEIPAAVIELAVYVEIKGRPYDGHVVVDLDLRIVDRRPRYLELRRQRSVVCAQGDHGQSCGFTRGNAVGLGLTVRYRREASRR
jgi:hypothetical protein